MDADISRRIAIARYIAIVAIVINHIEPYRELSELGNAPFELVVAFFVHGLGTSAVPLLTAISGWLLFSAGLDQKYTKLVANKTKTLLIPLLIWNIPLVLLVYFLQKYELLSHPSLIRFYPFDPITWLNGSFSLLTSPFNYPLYFLRDLFVLALLAPLFGFVLRRWPFAGLLAVMFITGYNLDGPLVLADRLIVTFYVGGMAAVLKWDLRYLDKYAVPLLIALLAFCLFIVLADFNFGGVLAIIVPFWVWPLFSLIRSSRAADFLVKSSEKSFLIFVSHASLLFLFWKLYERFGASVPYEIFWVMSPIMAVWICHGVWRPFAIVTPGLASLALGNRVAREGVEQRKLWLFGEKPLSDVKHKRRFHRLAGHLSCRNGSGRQSASNKSI